MHVYLTGSMQYCFSVNMENIDHADKNIFISRVLYVSEISYCEDCCIEVSFIVVWRVIKRSNGIGLSVQNNDVNLQT